MMPEIQDLLDRLQAALVATRSEWQQATVEAEMTDSSTGYSAWYELGDGEQVYPDNERLDDEIEAVFKDMRRRYADTAKGPWYRAQFVTTPSGASSISFEYNNLKMEWDNRLNAATDARYHAYAALGDVDNDVIAPMLGAAFTGDAEWPCRPGWRVARGRKGLAVISDGLSDPYADKEGPGLGVEVFMQTKEKILKRRAPIRDITGTWLFSAVADVCNTIAAHGGIPELLDKEQHLSIEVDGSRFPEALRNDDGRVGVLLGLTAKGVPNEIQLAEGNAHLVAITLLTRAELAYITDGGRAARIEVAEELAKKVGHLSMTKRDSVVRT